MSIAEASLYNCAFVHSVNSIEWGILRFRMTFAGGLSDDIRGRDTSRPPSPQKSWMNGMRDYRGENETNAIGLPVHSIDLLAYGVAEAVLYNKKLNK